MHRLSLGYDMTLKSMMLYYIYKDIVKFGNLTYGGSAYFIAVTWKLE